MEILLLLDTVMGIVNNCRINNTNFDHDCLNDDDTDNLTYDRDIN